MVRIHREPPTEGPPARGSGLYPLRRQISAARQVQLLHPLPILCAGSSTDQNSWPTPNRCGFNSRTAHHTGLTRRSSPRSITARCWFDSSVTHQAGLADMDMHSPFKRDEAGSNPVSRTMCVRKRRHSITDECAELLPRMMRVQISLPLPISI